MKRRELIGLLAALPLAGLALPLMSAAGPRRFKSSLNCYSFNLPLRDGSMDLFDVIDFCARQGFDAIDPTGYYFPDYPDAPADAYINAFKRQAFLSGLDISGTGIRTDFVNPDPERRAADLQLVRDWIVAAAKLGSPNLRIFTGKSGHEGYPREQVFEWMARDIRACCEFGREHGVLVALQNHNEFLKTAADVDELFERVDSDWLGLNLDIGSYRVNDPYAEIQRNLPRAITWQIKENVWIDGVETPTDFDRLAKIIHGSNYRGYLPLETLGAGDPFQKIPVLMNRARASGLIH